MIRLLRSPGGAWSFRLFVALVLLAIPAGAPAQPEAPADGPAFSLHSSRVATTRERPQIRLVFRQVRSLDFRVYRVNDAFAFFERLDDLHVLGSPEPEVPSEPTVIERISAWKASVRARILAFLRRQFSLEYRRARAQRAAGRAVARRETIDHRQFAQVPLLNAKQVVATWRERLPSMRDAEARLIPLNLPGPGVYVIEAVNLHLRAFTVVVVSDVGLVTKTSPGRILAFAANRFTGEPQGGCEARVLSDRRVLASGTTGPDGLFEASPGKAGGESLAVIARCGDQVAVTDPGGWLLNRPARELAAYIFTDKPIYRPGHTVHLKSVLRWREGGGLAPFDGRDVEVAVSDPNEKVVLRERRPVDEFGSVLVSFPVPAGAALGYYSVQVSAGDEQASAHFEVQEYRRPEFEVTARPASRFVLQGETAQVTVEARYYFGQPVSGALLKYVVHRQPYFSPLRWSEDEAEDGPGGGGWWYGGDATIEGTARLGDDGRARIEVPAPLDGNPADYSLRVEARVTDQSGREVSGHAIVHATVAPFLVTARTEGYVHKAGQAAAFTLRAMDYLGAPRGNVTLRVVLERLRYRRGYGEEPEAVSIAEGTVTTGADGRASWRATLPAEPGDFRLRAAADYQGRRVAAESWLWVQGRDETWGDDTRMLELVSDRPRYQPGDVARLTIKGQALSAAVLVTKEGRQVSWRQVVRPSPADAAIEVPIAEDDIGDVWVNVAFLADDRVFLAEKRVRVPASSRQLQVSVQPEQPVSRPGQPAAFLVSVSGPDGRPRRAQVSLGVIDEAVYGVKPDSTVDPVRFFYRREYSLVGTQFSTQYTFSGYSGSQQLLLARRRRPTRLADFKTEGPQQPQVRKEFPDAIYWTGDLVTGDDGTARVTLTYPDSLTTWRLTARAVTADTLAGQAVARTTTTKDLIVRVVPPRFLTQGDELVLPTVVHSYLEAPASVAFGLKVEGVVPAAAADSGAAAPMEAAVTLEPGGQQRFDWRFTAPQPGTARFTAQASAPAASDAVEVSLPVQPFGLLRRSAVSGSLPGSGEASASLVIPGTANEAGRTIEVSLAPSLAGPMLGALDFLISYPYGCTEQVLSAFVPNLVVLRALSEMGIAPPERAAGLDRRVSDGLRRLYDLQRDEGGWGWWKTAEPDVFMTAYALHGLVETRRAGYSVEQWRVASAAGALRALMQRNPRALADLKAYVAHVLAAADPEGGAAAAIDEAWAARDGASPAGWGLLALTLGARRDPRGDAAAQALESTVQRRGDLAWWPSDRDTLLGDVGDASVEATAFAVRALAARDPRHPLIEPAVRWIVLNRAQGTWWSSTKQTAMVLYALLDVMRARREHGAPVEAEVLVNGESAGRVRFDAASMTAPDPARIVVPALGGANTIVVRAKGEGTVYWSAAALSYDRAGASEPAGARKLALARRYFLLESVRRDDRVVYRERPLAGPVRPGDLVLVRLTAAGSPDWRYLLVEDPIPAGTEPIHLTELYPLERRRPRFDPARREYRDDRVALFQENFLQGRYDYEYILKVTTPGTFGAMPARIVPMYVPGVQASTAAERLIVEAAADRSQGAGR